MLLRHQQYHQIIRLKSTLYSTLYSTFIHKIKLTKFSELNLITHSTNKTQTKQIIHQTIIESNNHRKQQSNDSNPFIMDCILCRMGRVHATCKNAKVAVQHATETNSQKTPTISSYWNVTTHRPEEDLSADEVSKFPGTFGSTSKAIYR